MTTVLCTLYNSLYLDKGLVLYDSLCACAKDFKLYVLCMDEKCYEVLKDLNHPNQVPIRLEDFERGDIELIEAKKNRSFGEYCWTCTPSLILYVIRNYSESICTYIDSDLFFYSDPSVLVKEMLNKGKDVLIVPHRFTWINRDLERNGKYCVQFNTFKNTDDSMSVLKRWRTDCIACCTSQNNGKNFGDQKYMDEWPQKFNCVHVCSHLGAGVAPWNIQSYKLYKEVNNDVLLKTRMSIEPLVFYHYQNIRFIDNDTVDIGVYYDKFTVNKKLVEYLYDNYLNQIREKRIILKNHDISFLIKSHPAFIKQQFSFKDRLKFNLNFYYVVKKILFLYNHHKDILSIQ